MRHPMREIFLKVCMALQNVSSAVWCTCFPVNARLDLMLGRSILSEGSFSADRVASGGGEVERI